jgi:urease accessory protein
MRARARIVAEADGRGGTRLVTLRSETPLLLRHTPSGPGPATVFLVGGAAGPLGGDDLHLDIVVGPGAVLHVRAVAASIAMPARVPTPSCSAITATVGSAGTLHYLPEQLVAAAWCHHASLATVRVDDGGTLRWRDELVAGRHGEQPGNATVTTSVDYGGVPLLRQTLAIGPDADGWAGPAVLGGATATGSLLSVDPAVPQAPPQVLGPTAVLVPLAGPGTLRTATASDAHTLRAYLGE